MARIGCEPIRWVSWEPARGLLRKYRYTKRVLWRMAALFILAIAMAIASVRAAHDTTIRRFRQTP